ncbi:MAG TPA: MarR family transcriptional regulator [Acidimicrobiia bacterium]|jgi:DNA-binding MarR family transcriptional regulator
MEAPIVLQLRQASDRLTRRLAERLERAGVPPLAPSQILVLAVLDDADAPPAELARRFEMSRQSMQKHLDRLGALGFVVLKPNPSDRRSKLVTLTPDGARAAAVVVRLLDGFERRFEAALGSDAIHTLRRVLGADFDAILATDQKASGG